MRRVKEFQILDINAIDNGLDIYHLMNNAGNSLAKHILAKFSYCNSFIFVCGKGNNAGDGYVAASILHDNNLDLHRTIELYAKNRAVKVYENTMYSVNDASTNDHFNLLCVKEGHNPRRILVKATTDEGVNIVLSKDEVQSAKDKNSITDLFVVHSIIIQNEKNHFEVKGGKIKHLQNWEPNENALTPSQYNYKLPQ